MRGALGITDDEPESTGSANPYTVIIDKNVFRLNPPPPPPEAPATTPADLPQYKLTGIVKIGDQTRVLFALAPKDAKELPTYLNLAAGERQGQLELVSIDRDKEEVAVINSGMAMTLSVKSNSYAVSGGSVPAAPAAPGGRRLPGFPAPPPGIAPPPVAPAAPQAASAPSTGGVVIIGGGNSGGGGSSPNQAVNTDANYAQAGGNYGGGGSGVSVSGNNYGGVGGVGGATIATPNGTVPLNLGATAAPGQTASWPPPEQADPAVQAAALLAASEGLDNNGKSSQGTGGNGNAQKGPPMPPIKGLEPPTPH